MAEKLDNEQLLDILQRKEESAGAYVWGQLGNEREQALREYYRLPYGNEEEGWSQIVASDIQDTVEWILPSLLKVFSSTDKAVSFEPSKASDVAGAEQATSACNYVFYKQNNGFLILYTAFKDALTVRNCAVMWRKETQEVVSSVPFKGATTEMLAMILQEAGDSAEIEQSTPGPMMDPQTGQPAVDIMTGKPVIAYSGRIKRTEEKTTIKVESFSPEDLLIEREWTSPILQECPYVARMMRVTLSDLKQMGFDATPEELRASDGTAFSADASFRLNKVNQEDRGVGTLNEAEDDDALAEGWLRIEFVLVDTDGDGIAERRCIYRLQDKILKNEIVSHVPLATFSPILNTHRWDGMSMADSVSDLQKLHTELLRQTLNNLYLTNNPRTTVMTDANWSPLANIEDLLDSRAGGIVRQRAEGAVQQLVTPFAAGASMPMLQYVQDMRAKRTGVSEQSQGLNPDSLQNQAGAQANNAIISAAAQRIELIARIAAEVLLKPIFAGILKLLTDGGDMEKLAFRLRNEFVEYDPNEWRDQYDMTINVGLGTGDSNVQASKLQMIMQNQVGLMPYGLATPKNLFHTQSKIIENAGYKDVQNFITEPPENPPPQQPPPEVQLQQMKQQGAMQKLQIEQQAAAQKFQAEHQMAAAVEQLKAAAKQQETQLQLELQASNDARDGDREQFKAERMLQIEQAKLDVSMREADLRAEVERYKADLDASVKLQIAGMSQQASDEGQEGGEVLKTLKELHEAFMSHTTAPRKLVRGPDGVATGIDIGGGIKQIKRGADGRAEGF